MDTIGDDHDDPPPDLVDCEDEERGGNVDQERVQAQSMVAEVKSSSVTADIEKGPTKDGAQYFKTLRKKCDNTIYVCVEVMSLDNLQSLVRMIVCMIRPVYFNHSQHARDATAPEMVEQHYITQAKGEVLCVLRQVAQQWQYVEAFEFMGFSTSFKTIKKLTVNSPEVKVQYFKAEHIFNSTMHTMKHRIGSQ